MGIIKKKDINNILNGGSTEEESKGSTETPVETPEIALEPQKSTGDTQDTPQEESPTETNIDVPTIIQELAPLFKLGGGVIKEEMIKRKIGEDTFNHLVNCGALEITDDGVRIKEQEDEDVVEKGEDEESVGRDDKSEQGGGGENLADELKKLIIKKSEGGSALLKEVMDLALDRLGIDEDTFHKNINEMLGDGDIWFPKDGYVMVV
jgi:hypothetical protein